jgi:hypothetical protein
VNEYKYEIERTNRELQDVKRKYYQQRRKEQLAEEMDGAQGTMNRLAGCFLAIAVGMGSLCV